MKNRIFITMALIACMIKFSYCDVIPDSSHYVPKCVKITNIDEYPSISLIGVVQAVVEDNYAYIISSTSCLEKGYKFNYLSIYAVNNSFLAGKDINTIDFANKENALHSNIEIEPHGYYYHDSIPISGVEQYYEIIGFTDTSVILHMWKEVIKYNNGDEDSVQTFEYKGSTSALTQNIPTGYKLFKKEMHFTLFPNPTNNYLNIKATNDFYGVVGVNIYSISGQIIKHYSFNKTNEISIYSIPTNEMKNGVYLVNPYELKIIDNF